MFRTALVALLTSFTLTAAGKLDSLHSDGQRLRDSSNRQVILRGVVTITKNNDGKPMVMTTADYDQIRAWGFNVQQIRLEGCRMGVLPPCKADPNYMDLLDSWVNMAEERGIYTLFKATTYDVPGLEFQNQWKKDAWDKLWDTRSGNQDQFITAWARIWEHFKGRPAVIGYDLLNECFPGSNTTGFIHNYLFPFYRKAHAALERVDSQHLFVFQPALRSDDGLEPLGGANILYAPHFYPATPDPEAMYRNILKGGEKVQAPVLIGEYGLPNTPFRIPTSNIPASTPERDQGDALLFDQSSMSTVKTWYTNVGNWSLLTPEGSEHPRFQFFSRPFPQRTAGVSKGFSFDFKSRAWNYEWEPDSAVTAPTVVFVPVKRHYASGFRILTSDSLQLETDRKSPSGLRVTANPKRADAKSFRYDFEAETLTVAAKSGVKTLKISALE